MPKRTKLLFVCSGNEDRSPTAERLFANSDWYEARSAGTHELAKRRVSQALIDWSDTIFVMSEKEDGHVTFLREHFDVTKKQIVDLDIEDRYYCDDPKLQELLRKRLKEYLVADQ